MAEHQKFWAIIPAGGIGIRMGADKPKQYLELFGRPILHHTLSRICTNTLISGAVVGVQPNDSWWGNNSFSHVKLLGSYDAGESRANTVLNGLNFLLSMNQVCDDDWALVHDAVRPCIIQQDINNLIEAVKDNQKGAILGSKLTDTLKITDQDDNIIRTLDREYIWRAYTPQIFRIRNLVGGLEELLAAGVEITDEAMAMERVGHSPTMVQGHPSNIKITIDRDLDLVDKYLEAFR